MPEITPTRCAPRALLVRPPPAARGAAGTGRAMTSADPRRAAAITTRTRGVAEKRRAYLYIDGARWAVVEWGGPRHFEQVRDSAVRALHQIESEGRRSHWYGENAESASAQLAYADEHLERARQIIRTHDPDRAATMPAADPISAERVIEAARAERTARIARKAARP
jgi:hypothetical protein